MNDEIEFSRPSQPCLTCVRRASGVMVRHRGGEPLLRQRLPRGAAAARALDRAGRAAGGSAAGARWSMSLLELMHRAESHVATSLMRPSAWAPLRKLASRLPAQMTRDFIFEYGLQGPSGSADLSISILRGSPGERALAGLEPQESIDPDLLNHPVWRLTRLFGSRWSDPSLPIHAAIAAIWLEFDADGHDGLSPPAVHVVPATRLAPADAWPRQASAEEAYQAAALAAESVLGAPLAPLRARALLDLLTGLPPPAQPFSIGYLTSRNRGGMRVAVDQLPLEGTLDVLGDVGWSGPIDAAGRIVRDLGSLVERIDLQFYVEDALLPFLGLELHCPMLEFGSTTMSRLLDALVGGRLCTPGKRAALLSWCGWERASAEGVTPSLILRDVSHIKLTLSPDSAVTTKGYLWMGSRPAGGPPADPLLPPGSPEVERAAEAGAPGGGRAGGPR
ncbi:hypothetical protein [Sorangium sp. So ce426]|uniref:hypothetical protein n=1 Tax=Sorangium sp. So ce426 TaxID=3133312 RepID=UPI003F5BFD06